MKKHLMIATGLAVLSTSAFASTSRVGALGAGTGLWVQDDQRAFLNPASINSTNNYLIIEQGGKNDTAANERIQGGFVRNSGSFVYGAYMNTEFTMGSGDESVTDGTRTTTVGNGYAGTALENNGWDFLIGGDMGVQWGARLHYDATAVDSGNSSFAKEDTYSGLGLGVGIVMGDLDVYANLVLSDEYENKTTATDSEKAMGGGMRVGAQYGMGNWTFFFDMNNMDKEWSTTTAAGATADDADKYENNTMTIGAGHMHEISSTARIMTTVAYSSNTKKATNAAAGTDATPKTFEDATTTMPVTIAFEADANSWLTLRGSVSQSIFGGREFTADPNSTGAIVKSNNKAGTAFAVGGTLNFGKLKVDGIVKAGDADTASATNDDLNLDTLMTKVAVNYWF